ncbi:MAG: cytochrome c1 [Minwuia sp.]|uniref:cytochrome c1 n=1 Tax=Minwuia sp. TaxID=2493630 RepID=UPI003A897FFE
MAYRVMKTLAAGIAALCLGLGAAQAAGEAKPAKDVSFEHAGPFGAYDRAAVQRGLQVYKQVCAGCHGLKYVAFRTLTGVGFSEDQVKAIAAESTVTDGPDSSGEMFDRPARPADRFPSPFANDQAAAAAFGVAPPDLSLMSKARPHGDAYIYSLLTGYDEPDAEGHEITCGDGTYVNPYFLAGNCIAMAPPLFDDAVEYADGTPATSAQMAKDVTTFLAWAAEPKMEERKQMGVKVILFLIFLSVLLYLAKKQIWGRLH